jgi:hypothetical protein
MMILKQHRFFEYILKRSINSDIEYYYCSLKEKNENDDDKSVKTIRSRIENDQNIIFQRDDVYIEVSDDLVKYGYRK